VTGQGGGGRALEKGLIDAIRYGLAGNQSSVRQLAARYLRRPPTGIEDVEAFREALGQLLVAAAGQTGSLRQSAATLPVDVESALPLMLDTAEAPHVTPVLNPDDSEKVLAFIREQRDAGLLQAAGIAPARTLLLIGPPGVGKSITARYIASELRLPALSLDLAALMSSYLGRTGQNLRRALDYARTTQCVLFLDEFDALAKHRTDDSDVGELKRIVNVLLLELERWPSESILIAATNHPELLDRAVERRFDAIVVLGMPAVAVREAIIASRLAESARTLDAGLVHAVAVATEGWTGSDLERLTRLAVRREVLEAVPLDAAMAHEAIGLLSSKGLNQEESRSAFCAVAVKHGGMSQREVGRLIGVSHPTVARLVRHWRVREGGDPGDGQ